jgi:branched-chain amino acid transport system permease protein
MSVKGFLREKPLYLLLVVFALALPFLITNRYVFQIVIMGCLFSICTLSMNLILGYTGQVSLAHAGFFGIGAYGVALMTKAGVSFWLALPLASLIAAAAGLLIGLPTLRTRGSYFAIATLCFGVIISVVAGNWIEVTGGYTGVVGIPSPPPLYIPGIGPISFKTMEAQYYLVLAFLLLTLIIMHRLVHSLLGLSFMAIRNNEILAEAVGVNTFAGKLLSFVVANFFAGMAGGIYGSLIGSISPSTASIDMTFNWLIYLLLGGAATLAGPIIGAFVIPVVLDQLQFLQGYRMIIFGILLIVVVIYFPRGIMGAISELVRRARAWYERGKGVKRAAAG